MFTFSPRPLDSRMEDVVAHLFESVRSKRSNPHQKLIYKDTQSPPIDHLCEVETFQHLWRNILQCFPTPSRVASSACKTGFPVGDIFVRSPVGLWTFLVAFKVRAPRTRVLCSPQVAKQHPVLKEWLQSVRRQRGARFRAGGCRR